MCVRENIQYKVINDVPFELLSFANPLDYATLDIRLDLVLNVRKRDLSPTALHAIALETINTRFPPEEWLHIYTDGSLLDFAQGAGIGVFSHLFSFYLHAGPLTTNFDELSQRPALHSAKTEIKRIFRESFRLATSRVARDKPWSTLCKKSHGIPSSPRAAAVAKFRLLTGHDCHCAHLFRFNLVTSPICVLCDTGQDMTAAHLDECSALNDLNCIVKSIAHQALLFIQLSQGNTPKVQKIGRGSKERVGTGSTDIVLIRVESMIESTTNSNEFRSKDGTMVRIPDADFNIVPMRVTKNTTLCSTRIRTTTIGVNNQGLIRAEMNLTWKNHPAHHWHAVKSPGLSIQYRRSRALQTALERFRRGHLCDRWILRGFPFLRPRHRLLAVVPLSRLPRNRSIRV
ncbi:uncharacterized protein TNCV_1591531 [Trichonephila clavipes]|nr:uncharacterized protein TNCV_1591531 [Trichonephila clavipes]